MGSNNVAKIVLDKLASITTWISAEEELELIKKYKATGDPTALEALYYSFGRRLLSIFHDFKKKYKELRETPLEDMIGPAMVGLAYAVKKFDVSHKTRLISFSYFAILNAVKDSILKEGSRHNIENIEDCTELCYTQNFSKDIHYEEGLFNVTNYPKTVSQYELTKRVNILLAFIRQSMKDLNSDNLYKTWSYVELYKLNQFFPNLPEYSTCTLLDDVGLVCYSIELFETLELDVRSLEIMLRSLVLYKATSIQMLVVQFQDDIVLDKLEKVCVDLLNSDIPLMVYNIKYQRTMILSLARFYRRTLELSQISKTLQETLLENETYTEMLNIEGKFLCE